QLLDQSPGRPYIEDRLSRLMTEPSTNYSHFAARRGKLFFLKFAPPAQQAVLITLGTLTNLASQRVLVDPNALGENGSISIDWFVPSLDGKLIAVSLSEEGSERGALHFYDTESGKELPDVEGTNQSI